MKIYLIIAFLLMINLVNGFDDIGTYKSNSQLNLNLGCSYNNTYCPDTFSCNITIFNKDGIIINNNQMGISLFPQYNFTIVKDKLNVTGLYYGRQVCCGSIGCHDYSFQFNINAQGKDYTSTDGLIYIIMIVLLIGIFSLTLYGFFKLNFKNKRSTEGYLININWGKYLKIFLFVLSYLLFIALNYFAYNISYGILEFKEMSDFFYFMYYTSYILIIPFIALTFVFTLIMFVYDKKYQTMLQRGLTIK